MSKAAYIGVGGKARKTKKLYIGVAGKARKVKKAYIGVGGKARLFMSGQKVASFYQKKMSFIADSYKYGKRTARINDYGVLHGGSKSYGNYGASVNSISPELTYSYHGEVGTGRMNGVGCSVGNYALFAGGYSSSAGDAVNEVDTVDSSFTGHITTMTEAKDGHAAASIGNYALFAGGATSVTSASGVVNRFNSSLTRGTATNLGTGRYSLAGASTSTHAAFAGGISSSNRVNNVDAYNTSLTRSSTTMTSTRASHAGGSVGDYAVFFGGDNGSTYINTAQAFGASMTRFDEVPIPYRVAYGIASGSNGDMLVFGGGQHSGTAYAYATAFDVSLTVTNFSSNDGSATVFGNEGFGVGAGDYVAMFSSSSDAGAAFVYKAIDG